MTGGWRMRIRFVLLAVLLALLSLYLCYYGWMDRFSAYIEVVENTIPEKRAAISEAYRQSWGIDKWSISSLLCACASVASIIAAIKLPKKNLLQLR